MTDQSPRFPPRVWVSKGQYRLVSGGSAPDAGFVEFENSRPYVSVEEFQASLREAEARGKRVLDAARNLLKVASENEPEFQAHVRYSYADCQKILKPIAKAMELLDYAVEAAPIPQESK